MNKTQMTVALILTYMIFAMLLNSVGTVILQVVQGFGVSKGQASTLEAFKDLPIAIASFLVASFLPKIGYRRAMVLGLGMVALACASMPVLQTFWATKLMFATVGVAFALTKVAVYSSIGLLTDNTRAHAGLTSLVEGWFMVGILASAWLFAAFINPTSPGDPVWLNVYWVIAGCCVLVIGLLSASSMDESQSRDGNASGESLMEMLRLLTKPLVLVFLVSAFLYVLMEQAVNTWLPTFNREILHLPTTLSVQAASIFAGSLALGRLGAGIALRYLSWFHLLCACVIGMAVLALLALPLAAGVHPKADVHWGNAPLAAYVFPLLGLLMAPIYPAINSVVLSALPKSHHAPMTGLIVVFSALGGATGSLITGQLFAHFDGARAFYLLLVPMGLLLCSLVWFNRSIRLQSSNRDRAKPLK